MQALVTELNAELEENTRKEKHLMDEIKAIER